MAKTIEELFREKVDPNEIGNPQRRRELRDLYAQNQRQQMAEVQANFQANLDAGLSVGEAATTKFNPTNIPKPPPTEYTWHDGDTLQSVSSQFGIDPLKFVNANPDASTFQTGMVLKLPPPVQTSAPQTSPPLKELAQTVSSNFAMEFQAYNNYRNRGANLGPLRLIPFAQTFTEPWKAWDWWFGGERLKYFGR